MNFSELLTKYEKQKQYGASDSLELLTLTKKLYISNEISLQNYKELLRQIHTSFNCAVPSL
ncbi:YppF family protein [Rossellomorea aquimaris]|uniref:YppF family protein n=1 Tax=Rossellomorea aquimaris TaxID=189382 RepID=UPI001CD6D486|nr:YppF family protein [Rossellomorea aquimaris]MCA1054597.1 YppF family protein [Rossellomorea aquimaris]